MLSVVVLGSSWSCNSIAGQSPGRDVNHLSAVSDEDLLEASLEISSCTEAAVVPRSCKGEWRGLEWSLVTKTSVAQIDLPSGQRWIVRCSYDALEQTDQCFWTTSDKFFIIRGDGNRTFIGWGADRYPGSEMAARLDDKPIMRTKAESWNLRQSRELYSEMTRSSTLTYRWNDWPYNAQHDGKLDLMGFADAAALMEAIRNDFVVKRLLTKAAAEK